MARYTEKANFDDFKLTWPEGAIPRRDEKPERYTMIYLDIPEPGRYLGETIGVDNRNVLHEITPEKAIEICRNQERYWQGLLMILQKRIA